MFSTRKQQRSVYQKDKTESVNNNPMRQNEAEVYPPESNHSNTEETESDESVCPPYEIIDNPNSCLIRNQVNGNQVKMVLICPNGEQRLITFDRPSDQCTVQDLLVEAGIPVSRGFITFLVKDSTVGYNYIVRYVSRIHSLSTKGSKPSDVGSNKEENELLILESEGSEPCRIRKNRNRHDSGNSEKSKVENNVSKVAELDETDYHMKMETILETELVGSNNMEVSCENEEIDEDSSIQTLRTSLSCKIVMIGTYMYNFQGKVIISQNGVSLTAPHLKDEKNLVFLELKFQDILKVLIHFGEAIPVLFFYLNANAADPIREHLGMHDPNGPYYKPDGKDHIQRRITLLIDKMTDESKLVLKTLFTPNNVFDELSSKETASLLLSISKNRSDIRSQIRSLIKKSEKTTTTHNNIAKVRKLSDKAQGLTLISEKTESKFDHNVNDEVERLGEKNQNSTQVLDETRSRTANTVNRKNEPVSKVPKSFLKKSKASSKSKNPVNDLIQILLVYPPSPARGGITITAQDFACLGQGQFLNDVIMDFYLKYLSLQVLSEGDRNRIHIFSIHFYTRLTSLHSPITDSDELVLPATKRHANVQNWTKSVNIFEKDFIIVPINEYAHWFLAIICFPGLVGKTKKNSIAAETREIKTHKKAKDMKLQAANIRNQKEIKKFPCILIFDSLAGPTSRAKSVVANLQDYLTCEHLAKLGTERIFSEETMKGACPKVPQQNNSSDCGLYLLQYVESFFNNPITDYTLPITTLQHWFDDTVVTHKRRQISKLIRKLIEC